MINKLIQQVPSGAPAVVGAKSTAGRKTFIAAGGTGAAAAWTLHATDGWYARRGAGRHRHRDGIVPYNDLRRREPECDETDFVADDLTRIAKLEKEEGETT